MHRTVAALFPSSRNLHVNGSYCGSVFLSSREPHVNRSNDCNFQRSVEILEVQRWKGAPLQPFVSLVAFGYARFRPSHRFS